MSVRVKKFDSYSTAAPLGRRRAAAGGGARSVFGGRVYEELCARKSDSGWEEDEEDGIVITKRPSELQGPPRVNGKYDTAFWATPSVDLRQKLSKDIVGSRHDTEPSFREFLQSAHLCGRAEELEEQTERLYKDQFHHPVSASLPNDALPWSSLGAQAAHPPSGSSPPRVSVACQTELRGDVVSVRELRALLAQQRRELGGNGNVQQQYQPASEGLPADGSEDAVVERRRQSLRDVSHSRRGTGRSSGAPSRHHEASRSTASQGSGKHAHRSGTQRQGVEDAPARGMSGSRRQRGPEAVSAAPPGNGFIKKNKQHHQRQRQQEPQERQQKKMMTKKKKKKKMGQKGGGDSGGATITGRQLSAGSRRGVAFGSEPSWSGRGEDGARRGLGIVEPRVATGRRDMALSPWRTSADSAGTAGSPGRLPSSVPEPRSGAATSWDRAHKAITVPRVPVMDEDGLDISDVAASQERVPEAPTHPSKLFTPSPPQRPTRRPAASDSPLRQLGAMLEEDTPLKENRRYNLEASLNSLLQEVADLSNLGGKSDSPHHAGRSKVKGNKSPSAASPESSATSATASDSFQQLDDFQTLLRKQEERMRAREQNLRLRKAMQQEDWRREHNSLLGTPDKEQGASSGRSSLDSSHSSSSMDQLEVLERMLEEQRRRLVGKGFLDPTAEGAKAGLPRDQGREPRERRSAVGVAEKEQGDEEGEGEAEHGQKKAAMSTASGKARDAGHQEDVAPNRGGDSSISWSVRTESNKHLENHREILARAESLLESVEQGSKRIQERKQLRDSSLLSHASGGVPSSASPSRHGGALPSDSPPLPSERGHARGTPQSQPRLLHTPVRSAGSAHRAPRSIGFSPADSSPVSFALSPNSGLGDSRLLEMDAEEL